MFLGYELVVLFPMEVKQTWYKTKCEKENKSWGQAHQIMSCLYMWLRQEHNIGITAKLISDIVGW